MTSDTAKGLSRAGQYQSGSGTSFEDATAIVKSSKDSKTACYDVSIPSDWCFGPVAHGGYLSSLLSRAVSQHVEILSKSAARQLPNVLATCNITYVTPVLPGLAEIRIEDRSVGKKSSHFIAALYQANSKSKSPHSNDSSWSLRTEGTVFMTTTDSMSSGTIPRSMEPRRRLSPLELYSRDLGGRHVPHHDSGMAFYKYKPGWECYFRAESADHAKMLNKHPEHGPAVFDVWWKLDDAITVHELGLIADLIGPILFNYEEVRKVNWMTTKNMNVDVIRLPPKAKPGWQWLFCRMELIENVGDRFYCDVTMTDEDGNVVGIARQSCVMRPFELVGKSRGESSKTNAPKARI